MNNANVFSGDLIFVSNFLNNVGCVLVCTVVFLSRKLYEEIQGEAISELESNLT